MCRWWLALAVLTVLSAAAANEADDPEGLLKPAEDKEDGDFSIYVDRWTECIANPSLILSARTRLSNFEKDSLVHTPSLGLQSRKVECRERNGTFVDAMHCTPEISLVGMRRVCVDRVDCELGEWLPWRPRTDGALVRTRRIKKLPQGRGKQCDVIEEVRPAALDASAQWVPGPWGKCQVAVEQLATPLPDLDDDGDDAAADDAIYEDDNDIQDDLDDKEVSLTSCGGGIERREATCVRADGKALHQALCAHTPMPTLVQPCEVPCPRDCQVGEWSEWSACQPVDGCPLFPVQQLTTAGYSVRHRRVLSAASGGGAPCPPLEEKRTCSTPRCASWKALAWGPCVLNQPHTTCGPGRRTRELRCVGHDGKEAQHAWCSGTGAPARSERCRIACAGDCVVSAWGAWAACSAPCSAPHSPRPRTTRRRHILAHAAPDGWPCPAEEQLIQNETCNNHACATYSWLATPWGPCEKLKQDFIPSHNYTDLTDLEPFNESDDEEPCIEEGEMTRDVMCVQNNADVVREVLCAPLHRPASRRACTVRCRRGCKVEAWMPWSKCPNTCEPSKQVRTRVIHGGPNCGPTLETRPCPLAKSCGADVAWVTGEWSSCVLPPEHTCGNGYRIRSIWCGSASHRVETGSCAGQLIPHTIAPCHESCTAVRIPPSCDTVCADPFKYLDEPDIPTCICENVTLELMPADTDCILPSGTECGEGRSLRAALCMLDGKHVPMDICKKYHPLSGPVRVSEASTDGLSYDLEFPLLVRGPCSVPCARDCAVGPWGQWGPCAPEPGSRAAFRFRTREVIEEGSAGGRECGATLQRAVCEAGGARWREGPWSACEPQSLCGHDLINRTVTCIDSEGKQLDDTTCEAAGAGPAPLREDTCRAPCPADCVVSEWSDWSPCEQTKWGGRRDRTRAVLRPAARGGAPCPPLVAAEPCAPHSYSWHLAPWDDCQPLGGSPCGEGMKRRSIRCLRSDGVFVNDSFCPSNQSVEANESWCYVPCGVDCVVGEWGAWDQSACACNLQPNTHITHMRRTRLHLTSAVWPGRACPPTEQRAPCPKEPCIRLIGRPTFGCHIRTSSGEKTEGTCGWGYRSMVARCEVTSEVPAERGLETWRCGKTLPGRIVIPTPAYFEQEACEVDCACTSMSEALMGPWGAWGECRGGARSRSRQQRRSNTTPCRYSSSRYVTIEWANCTGETDEPIPSGEKPHKRAETHREHYHDGYLEGSTTVLAVVWTATLILSLYGAFMLYRGFLRCLRSRRMKTVTKV